MKIEYCVSILHSTIWVSSFTLVLWLLLLSIPYSQSPLEDLGFRIEIVYTVPILSKAVLMGKRGRFCELFPMRAPGGRGARWARYKRRMTKNNFFCIQNISDNWGSEIRTFTSESSGNIIFAWTNKTLSYIKLFVFKTNSFWKLFFRSYPTWSKKR